MRKIALALVFILFSVGLEAQYPPPVGAYETVSGSWTPLISSATASALGYVPPGFALYCYNTSTQQWVPADASCFGAAGGNPGGSPTQIQYQVNATTFGGVPGSSVSGSDVLFSGKLSGTHFLSTGTPSIVCGPGAGTSPSVCTITGTDEAGQIAVTTGSSPTNAGLIATVTLGNACPTSVYAVVRSSNANSASLSGTSHEYPDGFSAGSWTLTANANGLAAATAYRWAYIAGCK